MQHIYICLRIYIYLYCHCFYQIIISLYHLNYIFFQLVRTRTIGAAASVQAANMRHAIETQDADTRLLQEEEAEMSIPSFDSQGTLSEEDEQFLLHHEGDATVCNKYGTLEVISNTFLLYKVLLFKGGDLCKSKLDTCEEYKCIPGSYKGHCVKGFVVAGTSCEDGNKCTVGDTCDYSGNCNAGLAKTCDGPGQCESSVTCKSATGDCTPDFKSAGTSCNDANDCTADDKCNGSGGCVGSSIVVSTCGAGGQFTFTSGTLSATCTPFGGGPTLPP